MNFKRFCIPALLGIFLAASLTLADEPPYACWIMGVNADWATTNWLNINNAPLPTPGYPTNTYCVDIPASAVTIGSQDISTMGLRLNHDGTLTVTNGKSFTLSDPMNFHPETKTVGYVFIPDGYVNIRNDPTGTMYGLSFTVGTNNSDGYLDLGAEWGATNGFATNFGTLYQTAISLVNGGLRVDAGSISMLNTCIVCNAGQEMTFRGDWLNQDGTTIFTVTGKGTGMIDIAGNLSFGGCSLFATIDTNGVNLIHVGGDAILTNVTMTIGCTDTLSNPASSYDLVRVPSAQTIYTNGMAFNVASNGGFTYSASVETNRSGYDYLVITPGGFLPSVTITSPANESLYQTVTNLTIQATVTGRSSPISKVEFYYDDTNKIGEATNAPYSVGWTNVYAGYYELKAIATDANSYQGVSPVVGVNVQGTAADGRKVFITGGAVITYDPGCAQ